MKKSILTLVLMALWSAAFAQVQPRWTGILSDQPESFRTQLISSTENSITVNVQVPGFYSTSVTTPRGEAVLITLPKAVSTAQAGEPDLPMMGIPAIIGDHARMDIRVVFAQYKDFEGIEVAPSKGDFPRTIDPATVAYTYGDCYGQDAFFPASNVGLYEPYIIRDFRGQNMVVYPYVYNPVTKTLRVYYDMTVEMYKVDDKGENVMEARRSNTIKMDADFKSLYQRHFINYEASLNRYTPVDEEGDLLIICHDSFINAMTDFVNWKKTRGVNTTIVGTSVAGSTSSALKSYIQNRYNANHNLTHVLLVGDVGQIPGYAYTGASGYTGLGDNPYGQVAGNDIYNDIFIGRFSAQNTSQVATQVQRIITYERDLTTSATWCQNGLGVSTSAGNNGHYNEDDYQHIENLRTDLLGFGYSTVYQDYKSVSGYPSSTTTTISNHINSGVGIINYCNHGSQTAWQSHNYTNSHVNALTNDHKLPVIWSVACLNGKYDHGSPCFAEAWLRATNNSTGEPTGAIGGMFSYISQPWQPPMYGHDEMVDVLVESYSNNIKRTFGGCSFDGNMKIIDQYGSNNSSGMGTYMTWILFGDPTLTLRNAIPTNMNVTHASSMSTSATSFTVNASNGNGALATLTLNNEILGSATINNGTANITFAAPGQSGTATLTVFGYNKITYVGSVTISGGGTQSYTISVSANPTNGGTVSGGGTYNQGQQCTVSAVANSGYSFTNWTENGTVVSTNRTYTFTVTGNRTLVANFQAQPQQYTINVSANPSNGGTVQGGGTYNQGQSCTVTATANNGYTFNNWTENGNVVSNNASYTFNVTGNRTLVANFQAQTYTINAVASPNYGGTVTGGGTFNYGQTCTLTATPATGYAFVRWTKNGTQVSTNATYTFTVTESATYQAHFELQSFTITATANPTNGGTVTGGGTYNYNQSCTLEATPNSGYIFVNWTKNGTQVSTNATYTFTVTESASYVANFQEFTCEAPSNVTAHAISYTDIYINWDEVPSANAYDIYRNGTRIATDYPYVGSYYDTELPYGEYCYTIVAKCGLGDSDPSEEACDVLNIPCNAPANFTAEYIYENETDFGVSLHWTSVAPIYPEYFHLYRMRNTTEYELIADLQPEGSTYSYFDNTETGSYSYMLTAEYHFDGQVCVSDPVYASCEVTNVNETSCAVSLFPNPTKGEITLEGEGISHIRIMNMYGQTVYNAKAEGNQVRLDLSHFGKGIYMMHIDTTNGQAVKQIVVE